MTMRWILVAALLGGCAPQAGPAPTQSSPHAVVGDGKDYDPIAEGAEWVYTGTSGTEPVEVTTRYFELKQTSAMTTGKSETTTVQKTQEKISKFTGTFKRQSDRTITIDDATGQSTTMMTALSVGRAWNSGTARFKVEAQEAVTVPAGSYPEALKVTKKQGADTVTIWLAADVGLIKLTGPADGGGTLTLELKSFKIP